MAVALSARTARCRGATWTRARKRGAATGLESFAYPDLTRCAIALADGEEHRRRSERQRRPAPRSVGGRSLTEEASSPGSLESSERASAPCPRGNARSGRDEIGVGGTGGGGGIDSGAARKWALIASRMGSRERRSISSSSRDASVGRPPESCIAYPSWTPWPRK